MRIVVLLAAALAIAACEKAPPVKSSSGEQIERISFEESFPLSNDVKESSLRGERLRDGVVLMDKHGVLGLTGERRTSGVLDKSTLTIIVQPTGGGERRLSLRSCSVASVCAFFEEASAQGLVEHKPLVCRNAQPCDEPR
jgi:hypothetical protein